jgi:uncharacterized protein YodC (DUF2158 family)
MAEEFQPGDVVRLKSGGPLMTISSLGMERATSTTQGAYCSWFEATKGKQQKEQGWFPLTSLKKVNPDAESGKS